MMPSAMEADPIVRVYKRFTWAVLVVGLIAGVLILAFQ